MEARHSYNTLNLDYKVVYNGDALSPNQIIKKANLVFLRPVIVQIKGKAILRKDWDVCLRSTDTCYFVELPGEAVLFFVIYLIIAYVIGYLYNKWYGPDEPATPPTPSQKTVYSLTSDFNHISLGTPFPEHFGRFKCVPYLAQENYVEYEDHDQYAYVLGIIGVGKYSIEDVYIDTTPISDFPDSSYHVVQPNNSDFSIVKRIVYTTRSLSGTELSEDFIVTTVNAAGTLITGIGIDITFPSGLIDYIENNTRSVVIYIQTEVRRINDAGDAVSEWVLLDQKQFNEATTEALRYTLNYILPEAARYEVQIKAFRAAGVYSSMCSHDCYLGEIKGYGADHASYGDVSLIEVKVKASKHISSGALSKLNVVCTRKLYPVISTGFGITETATESIIDAFAYVITADNAGQQADTVLNFSELYALRTILSSRNNNFSHIFTAKTTCIEACKIIARCGRCIPILSNGLHSLVRDIFKSVPSQIYTDDDYTENSLSITHRLRTTDDPTCVEVEYVDPNSWQVQTVLCYDVGGNEDNPAKISLLGCTDRQHAYEEGMYLYRDDEYNRTTINIDTGLKGLIPSIGAMIYISANQIDWGQAGLLAHITETVATLSEPVDFGESASGKLILTSSTGGVLGPYNVTPGDTAYQVNITLSPTIVNTIYADGDKATKFLFGPAISDVLRIRVLKIVPADSMSVKIEGTIIHDNVYDEPGDAPSLSGVIPSNPDYVSFFDPAFDPSLENSAVADTGFEGMIWPFGIPQTGLPAGQVIPVGMPGLANIYDAELGTTEYYMGFKGYTE